jgi:hypothetical protein
MEKKLADVQEAIYSLVMLRELLNVTSGCGLSCIFYTDGILIERYGGYAVHQMWVWLDLDIRSKAQLVFSMLSLVLFSLLYDTLLGLYGLQRYVLFSLIAWVRSRLYCLRKLHIRLTLWCMNVNNCAGSCARTELR